MSARGEAERVVSRALMAEFHSEPTMGHSTKADQCWACDQARDTAIAALSLAGFLATDEEWGIEFPNGMREEFSTPERARAEATVLQRANPVVVSRRVTPWRSA